MNPNEIIPKIYLAIIILSAANSFDKADYNFPLFLFAYMVWQFPIVILYIFHIH